MPAATATLSDSAPPASGIATRCAAVGLSWGRIPAPSLPTITAMSSLRDSRESSARASGTPSAADAQSVMSRSRAQAIKGPSSSWTTGCRKVAPIAARNAFGFIGSALPRSNRLAAAPRLAALKIAHGRLQITADVPSRAGHVCPKDDLGPFMRIALTVAGSDSGGAAGIQADLKTFHQFGVFGTSAITAVTAQNTLGVSAWQALPAALVAQQIDALAEDLRPTAIKSGMLGSREIVETVAERIGHHRLTTYVLDPVMVATSGDRLLDRDAEQLIAR